jgi:hypothetical protein
MTGKGELFALVQVQTPRTPAKRKAKQQTVSSKEKESKVQSDAEEPNRSPEKRAKAEEDNKKTKNNMKVLTSILELLAKSKSPHVTSFIEILKDLCNNSKYQGKMKPKIEEMNDNVEGESDSSGEEESGEESNSEEGESEDEERAEGN